jgi:hypothetical protein
MSELFDKSGGFSEALAAKLASKPGKKPETCLRSIQ